jgi:hypothetical protein
MPIIGTAKPRTVEVISRVAEMMQCEPAVIDAILRVEANGKGFDHNGTVIIRPEAGKVSVCPLLTDAQKLRARKLGFTTEPRAARNQLLNDVYWDFVDRMAKEFSEDAAYWCTSFGAPQIMGFNYRLAGFPSIKAMVQAFADSEDAQIEAMGQFMKATGLVPALRNKRWAAIARSYNGIAYAQNDYDTKLARFYASSTAGKSTGAATMHDDDIIEFGDRGDKVKVLQGKLRDLGFYVGADGDFGPETKDQVMAFQRRHGLTVDGRVDSLTQKALYEAPPKEQNQKPLAQIVTDSTTVQAGVGTVVVGGAAITTSTVQGGAQILDSLTQVKTGTDVVKGAADSGASLVHSLSQVMDVVQHHMLLILGIAAVAFGIIAIARRVQAQRLRKVG